MNIIFHYPPELLNLLIDTIPRLCRSKNDVLLFFRGAGVSLSIMQDLADRLNQDKDSIGKFDIARTVLTRLNEKGEVTLRERREILKRVTEFEDFSTCWPNDQLQAKGFVAEIRRVVNVKDSFTRIELEREQERKQRQLEQQEKLQREQQRRAKMSEIRSDLLTLFSQQNHQRRGKLLEKVLNRVFEANNILVREAFTILGNEGEGIVEQIDGVIELEGNLYLVEMKWWGEPLGAGDVAQHLVRVFNRGHARGIFISASDYTQPAVTMCREALQKSVVVLCTLQEIVLLLERESDLKSFLKDKINAAIIHKNPFYQPIS